MYRGAAERSRWAQRSIAEGTLLLQLVDKQLSPIDIHLSCQHSSGGKKPSYDLNHDVHLFRMGRNNLSLQRGLKFTATSLLTSQISLDSAW